MKAVLLTGARPKSAMGQEGETGGLRATSSKSKLVIAVCSAALHPVHIQFFLCMSLLGGRR